MGEPCLDACLAFMRIPRFADTLFLQAAHISLVLDELAIVDERLRCVAQHLGITATICMPANTPRNYLDATRGYGWLRRMQP